MPAVMRLAVICAMVACLAAPAAALARYGSIAVNPQTEPTPPSARPAGTPTTNTPRS
jgi:hypothetical protein